MAIKPPNFAVVSVVVEGTEPLVIERFAKKAELMAKMSTPGSKNKKDRSIRDYDNEAEQARYREREEGWEGFNTAGIRHAVISACRLVGFKMTLAKLSIFVEQDGMDVDYNPLVRIFGESRTFTSHTRNATGVIDIRSRPQYPRWAARLKIRYDADQFNENDVVNLVSRVGLQVGLGAGRPDSKQSAGCGWGLFRVVPRKEEAEVVEKYKMVA